MKTPLKYTSLSFTKRSRSPELCLSANRVESVQFPALSHLAYRGGEKSALSPISRNSAAICGDIYEGNKLKPLHSLSYGTRNSLACTHTAVLIQADNVERARWIMEPGHESAIWFTVKLFGFLIGWNCDLIFWADVFVWLSLKAAASELFAFVLLLDPVVMFALYLPRSASGIVRTL